MSASALAATRILAVHTGKTAKIGASGIRSAIDKQPRREPVLVLALGADGDEQADPRFHGGPEKALLHYAAHHYDAWQAELPERGARFVPGGFGENIVSRDWDETNVCIGDLVRLGSVLAEVTQPRAPCFKLNHRFDVPAMSKRVQDTGRTGWYYRVVEEGTVKSGDRARLVERRHPDWPLRRVQRILYIDTLDSAALTALIAMPEISAALRQLLAHRLRSAERENWQPRLTGEGA